LTSALVGPKKDEVAGGWRKLHNEELDNLYSCPSIITMIKLRKLRWAGHVARMGEKRNAYRILVGNLDITVLNSHALFNLKNGKNIPLADLELQLIRQIIPSDGNQPLRLTERHFPSPVPPTPKKM
jgi:hypothetical protein